jgi:hypothetical protein
MTALIVALSTADVTVRAGAVGLLAAVAIAVVGLRIDWNQFRRHPRRVTPLYLRVDQRPGQIYRPPSIRRRAAAAGGLAGFAIAGGVIIALVVSVAIALLVESITGLLR